MPGRVPSPKRQPLRHLDKALLCLLNAIVVTATAMSAYEVAADPLAEKKKPAA